FHKISHDVKIAALNLHENGILPLLDILASVGFSESTFIRFYGSGERLVMLFHIDMATSLDALACFISTMFSI
ncbi:hypothetical protein L208DRAFT_1483240, partial [Tricholoma matsutake]